MVQAWVAFATILRMSDMRPSSHWRFQGNEATYLQEALDRGFTAGPTGTMRDRFEDAFRKKFGVRYAVTSNSGTSPLHQALAAFGVGPGDEVIIPPLGPVMPAYTVIHAGAIPVFADVDEATFLLDPTAVEKKITSKTKAIMPVHLYGGVCEMQSIMAMAKKHDLFVLEDCAQCLLGIDASGRYAGAIGDAGSFSFDNVKQLSTGEGGMLITDDEDIALRARRFGGVGFKGASAETSNVRKLRDDFQDPSYQRHNTFGFNYRMSEPLAAIGLAQFERVDEIIELRCKMAAQFTAVIEDTGCSWIVPQKSYEGSKNSYWIYAARYEGESAHGTSWKDFRKKFMEFGGDGIYSAWDLMYREPSMRMLHESGKAFEEHGPQMSWCKDMLAGVSCPSAESLQPKMLQFTTNQQSQEQRDVQAAALRKTIEFFGV